MKQVPLAVAVARPLLRARFRHRSKKAFKTFLEGARPHGLAIGAGQAPIDGWLNTDTVPFTNVWYLDASRRFPFDDHSFDYVYSEHMIEHISVEDALRTVAEFFRVLRPGGRVRLATPGLEYLCALYEAPYSSRKQKYVHEYLEASGARSLGDGRAQVLNRSFRAHGHCFIHDRSSLGAILETAGFREVTFPEVMGSSDPHLRGLETRATGEYADLNNFETMVVEATR